MALSKKPSFFQRLSGVGFQGKPKQAQSTVMFDQTPEEESTVNPTTPPADEAERVAPEEYSDEKKPETPPEQEGQLTVDVFQDEESVVIQSTIAGVSPDDLDISITNDMVTIRGQRRRNFDVPAQNYLYQECYWGAFSRSIVLPIEIDADRAEAKIKNGILTIRIPKAHVAVTKKLKVKAG